MAVTPLYLADTSALARLRHTTVSDRLGPLLVEGLVATCPIIDLEVLHSARSLTDYEGIRAERRALRSYPITEAIGDRAIDIQHDLARRGHHRLSLPDLLIAAVAGSNDLAVIHYDAGYDRIAGITGQTVEWVAPRGSL